MLGIILAIIVAFLKSLGELAWKVFTDEKKKSSLDEYTLAFGARFISIFLLFPLIFFISSFEFSGKILWILLISSFLNSITTVTALKAVKYGELSIVSPLLAVTLPFLIVSSYFITGESLNSYGYIGVWAICIGTYFLQIHTIKNGIFSPILALYHNLWARYMLLTALLWSITGPLDKLWVLEMWALQWMFYTNMLASVFLGLYMYFVRKTFPIKTILQVQHLKKVWVITILWGTWVFLQMLALKYTLVVYVIALKRASWIFSVFLWMLFFKEKHILQRIIAASIMLAWVCIISILWNI